MNKTKTVSRQLRLTTPVSEKEKRQATRLAKSDGFKSVAELVRHLLAQRHLERRQVAAKERADRKNVSAKSHVLATKPARKNRRHTGAANSTRRATTKKALERGVVGVAGNKAASSTRRSTNRRTTAK